MALVLPYMTNSSNWHIREELLNVLIMCFLKSRNFYEFDAFQIIEAILKLFSDQKDKVRNLAMETLIAYSSIGNKFSVREVIFQLADKVTVQLINDRLELEMIPYINNEGMLHIPYLDYLE